MEKGGDARLEEGLAGGSGDEGSGRAGRAGRVEYRGGMDDEGLGVCAGAERAVSGAAAANGPDLVAC